MPEDPPQAADFRAIAFYSPQPMQRALLLCVFLLCPNLYGAEVESTALREGGLRAGYLINFAKFVEWPSLSTTDTLTVCFAGDSPTRDAFQGAVVSIKAGSHPLAARIIEPRKPFGGCQILYVGSGIANPSDYLSANAAGMLTVGEGQEFLHVGGIVELFNDNNRLRFNISVENARRAHLKISSSLLQLASRVEESSR